MSKQQMFRVAVGTAAFLCSLGFVGGASARSNAEDSGYKGVIASRLEAAYEKTCERLTAMQERYSAIPPLRFCKTQPTTPPPPPSPTVSLDAAPLDVLIGSTTTLSWHSSNASACEAQSGWTGNKALSGDEIVTVSATTTYSLACGNGQATTTDSVTVNAHPLPEPPPHPVINHIVISEVHYDVDGTHGSEPANEWIELFNGTGEAVDVGGWFIGDAASTSSDMIPSSTVIPDGGFLLITASSTTESFWTIPDGVDVVVTLNSLGSNGLANAGDALYLNNGETTVDAMSYGTDISVFDPSVADADEGHSVGRIDLEVDTDTAADWEDVDVPTPGSLGVVVPI